MTMTRLTYMSGGRQKLIIFTSAHLPYNIYGPLPTKKMREPINYYRSRDMQLITRCDANAHSTNWVSTGTNPRGESLMKYLVSSNLNIL
jgi:hypothetical protein